MSCHLCHVWAVSLLPDEEDELVTGDGESPQQLEVGQVVRGEAGGYTGLHGLVVSLGFLRHRARQTAVITVYCPDLECWGHPVVLQGEDEVVSHAVLCIVQPVLCQPRLTARGGSGAAWTSSCHYFATSVTSLLLSTLLLLLLLLDIILLST